MDDKELHLITSSGAVPGGQKMQGTRLIGLTGGIACGKSSVSRSLAKRGAVIVDADLIARKVVAPQSQGLSRLIEEWGEDLLTAEGELDRAQLGAIIFSNPEAKKRLDQILHPFIAAESARQIHDALQQMPPVPLVVYDAALLVEAGRASDFRPLVVVYSHYEIQLNRVMERDRLTRQEAINRVQSQMPALEKAQHADWIILNEEEGIESLEPKITALWEAIHPAFP